MLFLLGCFPRHEYHYIVAYHNDCNSDVSLYYGDQQGETIKRGDALYNGGILHRGARLTDKEYHERVEKFHNAAYAHPYTVTVKTETDIFSFTGIDVSGNGKRHEIGLDYYICSQRKKSDK